MIKQTATGLSNLSDASPYLENGCLPLITAPSRSVVSEDNYLMFLEESINICFPLDTNDEYIYSDPCYKDSFFALSLEDFTQNFIVNNRPLGNRPFHRCIETSTGNSPELFEVIRKAKEIHGDTLMIMAGNVGSVKAFVELAKAGCDYIRVGINEEITKNTGVGVKNLAKLVKKCAEIVKYCRVYEEIGQIKSEWFYDYKDSLGFHSQEAADNLKKVKIVADNIYPYIKQCELKYGFNINGYAAINKLLFSGADLVMLDKLLAQCVESAGSKRLKYPSIEPDYVSKESAAKMFQTKNEYVEVQVEYLNNWIPVEWDLAGWLKGSANSINYPFLTGWIDSLKLAMAYTNKSKL